MKKQTLTIAALTLAAVTSYSQSEGPSRGVDVDDTAGNCGIGPFQQTSKAGSYNVICADMTDSEKCLALIKGQLYEQIFHGEPPVTEKYHFYPVSGHHAEIMTYCLNHLRSELLPNSVTPPNLGE